MQEAIDFKDECDALAAILENADDAAFETVTQFKGWTIEDVIGHLFMWNHAAAITLQSRDAFQEFLGFVIKRMGAGENHIEMQRVWLDETQGGVRGRALYDAWRRHYPGLAAAYQAADPEARVAWAGPDMTTRSKIIARQMETWAHGQEVFDILGLERADKDRIRNICHLGVTTYSWTFKNRMQERPAPKPYVNLTAPSGAKWEWNEPQADNSVSGDAVAFAQVVTQTRNIADTDLVVKGDNAERWMAIAQCFAGGAEDPPAKGARRKV